MLEIDNRYPEYARPYEPVKGRRRHGPLTGNEAMAARRRLRRFDLARRGFLTGVGVIILVSAFMPARTHRFIMPRGDHKVAEIVRTLPEKKDIPVVIPEPEPEPYVDPDVPDPTPDPNPTPNPNPKPKPKPDPKPKPEPKPKPKPKPKPEPEPEDEKIAPVVDLEKAV